MKDRVNASLVQFRPSPRAREQNAARMAELVRLEAGEHDADLVVFPELTTTGYLTGPSTPAAQRELAEAAESVPGPTTEVLGAAAQQAGVYVVAGLARRADDGPELYNSAVLVGPEGTVLGVYDKAHLTPEEQGYFRGGQGLGVMRSPLGILGLEICYDVRFPELARAQALSGAEILITIWAMYEQGRHAPRDSVVLRTRSRAAENVVYVLGCNRTGVEGRRSFFGRSAVAAPSGDLLAASDSDSEVVVRATLESSALLRQRAYLAVLPDRRPELYRKLTESDCQHDGP